MIGDPKLKRELVIEEFDSKLESDFVGLIMRENPRNYDDVTTHFGESIIESHRMGYDPYGYFTKSKKIWMLKEKGGEVLGYDVITEKRGGCVKSGPLIIRPQYRNRGFGTYFKQCLQEEYRRRGLRKMYATFSSNDHILFHMNVNKLKWEVESVLKNHYKMGSHEIICSIGLENASLTHEYPIPIVIPSASTRTIDVSEGIPEHANDYWRFLLERMSPYYTEIDDSFFLSVSHSLERFVLNEYSKKGKKIFVATAGSAVVGLLVVTPKRGGGLKLSPLMFHPEYNSKKNIQRLVSISLEQCFLGYETRKPYAIVPYSDLAAIRALLEIGFTNEGVLRNVYKTGVHCCVMSRFTAPTSRVKASVSLKSSARKDLMTDDTVKIKKRVIRKRIDREYFQKILDGTKTFELRLADFDCESGDILILEEWDSGSDHFTGRWVRKVVKYVRKIKEAEQHYSREEVARHGMMVINFD